MRNLLIFATILIIGCGKSAVSQEKFRAALEDTLDDVYHEAQVTICMSEDQEVLIRYLSSSSSGFEFKRLSEGLKSKYANKSIAFEIKEISTSSEHLKTQWNVAVSGINFNADTFKICDPAT